MLRRAALAASMLLLFVVNAASAANGSVTITNDHYSVSSLTVNFSDQVTWMTNGGQTHHHTATGNLIAARGWGSMAWSFDYPPNSTLSKSQTFHQAGGWQFHCLIHSTMRGTVNVTFNSNSSTGPLGTTFTLTLGNQALSAGFVHDIQKRKVGGSFKTWKMPSASTQTWKPAKRGTFQFQTRVRNTANGDATLYSPPISITVS